MFRADCWWQIPPFGKDFHSGFARKIALFAVNEHFGENGTTLVWLEAGLGP
jgi:hypothetical protein